MRAASTTGKRALVIFAGLLIVTPAKALQPIGLLQTVGVVIKLTYFGSGSIASSETTIDFKRTNGVEIKCGSVTNTSFRIGAVGRLSIDDFVKNFRRLMVSYLNGTPVELTVTCTDNLPEIINVSDSSTSPSTRHDHD